jgi:DNA (cytosine-5)-methyltransferase 1
LRMTAYYNEHDPFAAAWLRNLIAANVIAPGDVDERSIEDVLPLELYRYTQCHFFAGIGVHSYAMRKAGWPDERPAWTGSCPCQPFSAAGEGKGFADERHLWPAFFHLISQCEPDYVFGEQVASKDGLAWLDLVHSDMEASGYAFGATDTCAAGFGAPHIRQRLYWVAHRNGARLERWAGMPQRVEQLATGQGSVVSWLADDAGNGLLRGRAGETSNGRDASRVQPERLCDVSWLADPVSGQLQEARGRSVDGVGQPGIGETHQRPGPINGFWGFADWLRCRDERWRAVEAGSFPLVNGAANRVGLLRGYGNAIVAPQAEEFYKIILEYAP